MRWLVSLILLGCSSAEVSTTTDTAAPTCATTSCVPGASCRTPSGSVCQCFDAGEWSCGAGATIDSGAVFDTGRTDTKFVAPPADTTPPPGGFVTYAFSPGGCVGAVVACTEDPGTWENARTRLVNFMVKCGLTCNALILELTEEGCPLRVSVNFEPVEGALTCLAKSIESDLYQCTTKMNVEATAGCLD
jgi:hypothetical protein